MRAVQYGAHASIISSIWFETRGMIVVFPLPPLLSLSLTLSVISLPLIGTRALGVNANVRAANDADRSGGAVVIFHPRRDERLLVRVPLAFYPYLWMHQWRIGRGCFLITYHITPLQSSSLGGGRGMGDRVFFQIENAARIRVLSWLSVPASPSLWLDRNREQKETAGNRDPGSSHSSSTRKRGRERGREAGRSRWIALNRVLRLVKHTAWIRWMRDEFSRFPASRAR